MSKLITAKVLSERKYGDKDKVKIVVPSRVSTEVYDNDGIDSNDNNRDYTQMAVVACNNNLAKDDLVWITYLDDAKTQPVIVSPYWGKTSSDNFNENAGNDPSDPTTDLLDCGVTLADLGVIIIAYGEGTKNMPKLDSSNIKGMIEDKLYAQANADPGNGKLDIGIRQWNGGRANSVYKYIYNIEPAKSKKLAKSDNAGSCSYNEIKKVISTSYGKEGQWEAAKTGKGDTDKADTVVASIKLAVKNGIKDNACILYYVDIANQFRANENRQIAYNIYKKLDKKTLKNFHNACMKTKYGKYSNRRKCTYHNIKMMQDAGWLKGKAGNLTNVFDNGDGANEKTGWVFPISDKDGKFKLDKKWRYKDGIRFAHKDGKSEGKKAISMYKGKVKKVEVVGQSYTVGVELRTKTNAKHYVEYCSLGDKFVKEGDSINKNDTIGTLNSNGLLIKVHKNKSKSSEYVNPEEYVGSNVVFGSGGFGGNPSKFAYYNQGPAGKYRHHNYGSGLDGADSRSACGIFSLSMMLVSFSGSKAYVPSKLSNISGTGIAQKWGLAFKSGILTAQGGGWESKIKKHKNQVRCTCSYHWGKPSLKTIQKVASRGGAIFCNTHGVVGSHNYAAAGHFFTLIGITKNNKILLADPGGFDNTYYKLKDPAGGKGTNHGISLKNISIRYYYIFYPA